MISTVKIYFSLFFSLSGHVYSQFPEIEISKHPTSRLGHPKEKQDRKVFYVINEGFSVKLFELSRFDYFWMSFGRIMFMNIIDKTVVRNTNMTP